MPKQGETKFKERVLADLRDIQRERTGFKLWFVKIQMVSVRGIPDIILCVAGHFVAIELKVGTNEPDPLQKYTLGAISDAGGVTYVVTPENWEEVRYDLKEMCW